MEIGFHEWKYLLIYKFVLTNLFFSKLWKSVSIKQTNGGYMMKKTVIMLMIFVLTLGFVFGCAKPKEGKTGINSNTLDEDVGQSNFSQEDIIFQDEFNGSSLDLTKWSYDIGNGDDGWGNQEKQYYRSENVEVRNGKLVITPLNEPFDAFQYTSGKIKTEKSDGKGFAFTYGKIEARIKSPQGEGMWPAFWMMPNDFVYGPWPKSGEIDIMEGVGRLPNQTSSAIHYGMPWQYKTNINYFSKLSKTTISDWHIYGCVWAEDKIEFYVDNELFYMVRSDQWYTSGENAIVNKSPFDKDFCIMLNLAIGGKFDNHRLPTESDFDGARMEVDYVRVYANK